MLVSRDGLFSNIFTANLLAHLFNLILHRYDNEEQGIMRPRRVKLVAIPFYYSNEMVERVKTKFVPVNHDSAEVEFFSHTSFDSGLVEKSVHATNVTKRHKKRS